VAASVESKLFNLLLRAVNKKKYLGKQLASSKISFFDCPEPISKVKKTCHIERTQLQDRNVFTLTPKKGLTNSLHILYLHGGAYIQSFNRFHWKLMTILVENTGCTITAPDYPLAPAHSYRDSFRMVSTLYKQMTGATDPRDLIIMGDSSGGGFALGLAQKIRDENVPQPKQIILLCPWLDIALENPDIAGLEQGDPFLERQSLQLAGKLYAGGTTVNHHLLSPINGSLNDLGKISIFIGSKEILVADARKLRELASVKDVDIDYYEYKDMVHGWMFLDFPESKEVRQRIINLINHRI
jgi:epsilon-lactone hydrolase